MLETTQCFIIQNNKILMMFRNKKRHDLNAGKWIGVGGKLQDNENDIICMKREVEEETGLIVDEYIKNGTVRFVNDEYEELMHVFTINKYHGVLKESIEGDLAWVDVNKVLDLPMWEGDKYFLSKVLRNDQSIMMELVYSSDKLIRVIDKESEIE